MKELDWGDPLPEDLTRRWSRLMDSLKKMEAVAVPRCYFDGITADRQTNTCQLHGFVYALAHAYGGVVYGVYVAVVFKVMATESNPQLWFVSSLRKSTFARMTIP